MLALIIISPLCSTIRKEQVKMEQTRIRPEEKTIKGARITTCLISAGHDRYQWLNSPVTVLQMSITVLYV